MADKIQEVLGNTAQAAHDKLGSSAGHNQFVNEMGRQLSDQGTKFQYEKPVISQAENVCKPDLDITTAHGETVAHVEVKTGSSRNIDKSQLRNYQTDGKDVYLVHKNPDGADPTVKKIE